MLLSVLLLLLLMVCSTQAISYGIVTNYYPRGAYTNRSSMGTLYVKWNSQECSKTINTSFTDGLILLNKVDMESSGEWCQSEGFITDYFSSNADFSIVFSGGNWTSGNKNGITTFKAATTVDLRIRSDIGKANTSPQTTIIPAVRVPSNCQRNFSLLMFDPDGDDVKCRYLSKSLYECVTCTPPPPSILSLSQSSCTLSFSPTNSSNEGLYVIELMMHDYPRETITLTQTNMTQMTTKTTKNAISKISVQFAVRVDPAVPSCTEGLFLPKFLPPTPANGDQLHTNVSQTLKINIRAEGVNSTISELLFSGPQNATKSKTGPGKFRLTWTPSWTQAERSHPICFVVQALYSARKYHSELRCIIVNVGNESLVTPPETATPKSVYVVGSRMKISPSVDLSQINMDAFLKELKRLLVKNGLPPEVALRLRSTERQTGST